MALHVVMGVSGCGKSSLASALAWETGGTFIEGDDFHSEASKAKMSSGIPLDDKDRESWLDLLNRELTKHQHHGKEVFLACSALRQTYRDRLGKGLPPLQFIYLKGSRECLGSRLAERSGHFMPASLLESQFEILEEPKTALVISVEQSPRSIITETLDALRINPATG
jgi:gluconokinase